MRLLKRLFRCVDCGREIPSEGICPECRVRTGRQLELFSQAA